MLYAFLACLIWGTSPIVMKLLLSSMQPLALAFYRNVIAAVILAIFLVITGRIRAIRSVVSGHGLMRYALLGFFGITIFNIFFVVGVQFTTASRASLLYSANPVIIVVLANILLKEKMNVKKLLGVLLGFVGALFVIVGGKDLSTFLSSGDFVGDILAFGSGFFWAIFSVAGRKWTRGHEAYASTWLVIFLGVVLMFPLNAATHSLELSPSTYELALLLYLGIFAVVVTYFLWIKALTLAGASKVGIFQFISPLVTVLLSSVILAEIIDIWIISSIPFIVSSIYLTTRSEE